MALNTAELPRRLDELVSLLRSKDERNISLVDVASVTGILIATMQAYFSSIDTTIYTEFASLSKYIDQARKDIASLQPSDMNAQYIPRAGQELDAIVESTEAATNTIMQAAEEIMAADTNDTVAYQELVGDAVMRIFEACSFQDITGQRISKVVETFTYIEGRLNKLASLVEGVEAAAPDKTEESAAEKRKREQILNGPQLKADAKDQNEVDALFGAATVATPEQSNGSTVTHLPDAVQPAATNGKAAPAVAVPVAAAAMAAADEGSNQSDIDAMFN